MGYQDAGLQAVRAGLYDRIEAIQAELASLSSWDIVERVDAVRRIADDAGLASLADMAHGVSSLMAWHDCRSMVPGWIDALKEALDCADMNENDVRHWLASLGLRLTH